MMKKKGWIRIVEAIVGILLITGVLLVIIDKQYIEREDVSSKVYNIEFSILREIQLNDTLRKDILNADSIPESVKNKIIEKTTNYLECEGKVCKINEICGLDKNIDKNIYARSIIIAANLETYNPKQLKLFCWERGL